MAAARLTQLLNRYFDGELTDADKTELERTLMESSPHAGISGNTRACTA